MRFQFYYNESIILIVLLFLLIQNYYNFVGMRFDFAKTLKQIFKTIFNGIPLLENKETFNLIFLRTERENVNSIESIIHLVMEIEI